MPTYIVRPYFEHDCDSEQGFNNGQYLDEITVEADSPEDAAYKALDSYAKEHPETAAKHSAYNPFECSLYWEYDHIWVDSEGIEYESEDELPIDSDTERPVEAEVHYRYQYIDFNDVQLAEGVKS